MGWHSKLGGTAEFLFVPDEEDSLFKVVVSSNLERRYAMKNLVNQKHQRSVRSLLALLQHSNAGLL
jgi:hypothetical protein